MAKTNSKSNCLYENIAKLLEMLLGNKHNIFEKFWYNLAYA